MNIWPDLRNLPVGSTNILELDEPEKYNCVL
jgi:hypothetical protein